MFKKYKNLLSKNIIWFAQMVLASNVMVDNYMKKRGPVKKIFRWHF